MAVTDLDRAIFELIIDPALMDGFELVPVTVEGVECALLVSVSTCQVHGVTLNPVAVIVNDELLTRLIFGTEG